MTDFDPAAVPPSEDGMTVEEARALLEKAVAARVAGDCGQLFEDRTIAAAALLLNRSRADYHKHKGKLAGVWRDFDRLVRKAARAMEAGPGEGSPGYHERDGCLFHVALKNDQVTTHQLTNFTCRIERQRLLDDGATAQRRLAMRACLGGSEQRFEIAAEEFAGLRWVVRDLGADALIYPGAAAREHVPHAMQVLSMPTELVTVYGHVGWRRLGGEWLYLHAGGALGAKGPVAGITCEPGLGQKERLEAFALPAPVSGARLRACCEALARMIDVYPTRTDIGLALLCAGLRAPFGHALYLLALVGTSGGGKSVGAALAQQMYAPGLDAFSLPLSWQDTATTLEGAMFWLRDAVAVIDDFAPEGGKRDQARINATLARVIRSIGNHAGRGRSNADLSARPDRPPMCVPVATLETGPLLASQVARCIIVVVPYRAYDSDILTVAQGEARLRSEAAATLICRMAKDRKRWLARFKELRQDLVAEARPKLAHIHPRAPDNIADLATGLFAAAELLPELLDFVDLDLAWSVLLSLGEAQGEHVQAGDQSRLFIEMIRAAVASKAAHLSPAAAPAAAPPEGCEDAWGWEKIDDGYESADPAKCRPPKFRAKGPRIGWVDGALVFLNPAAAYAMADRMAERNGTGIGISANALWRMLKEKGWLARHDKGRNLYKVTDWPGRVVCVRSWFDPAIPANPAVTPIEGVGQKTCYCGKPACMTGPGGNWCADHLEPWQRA